MQSGRKTSNAPKVFSAAKVLPWDNCFDTELSRASIPVHGSAYPRQGLHATNKKKTRSSFMRYSSVIFSS